MNLDTALKLKLKTWIMANMPPGPGFGENEQAAQLNQLAVPDYFIFRSSVTTDRARDALVWSEILAQGSKLPAEERWCFDTMMKNGTFDPGIVNNRTGLTAIFAGTAFTQTRNNLLATSVRKATLAEKVLSNPGTGPGGGNGSAGTAAAVMGFHLNGNGDRIYAEGILTTQNIVDAMNTPG